MKLDFKKGEGLMPVVIQDMETRKVLMLGYMNREAYDQTTNTGLVTFFSRSREELWVKGETSGNYLHVEEILPDCDGDTLLIKVRPAGPVCHEGSDTCFKEKNKKKKKKNEDFLVTLREVIKDRKINPKKGSYTTRQFERGVNKIAEKVGEEAVEMIIDAVKGNRKLFIEEAADLLFHYLVLIEEMQCSLDDVVGVLEKRNRK